MQHKVSIIISTYNNTEWLKKVLYGYEKQTELDFDIVIADDGSDHKTADLIKQISEETSLQIKHVWHEDNGFQKSAILNKAIVEAPGNYLIFTDGDCIPRPDFVETHINLSEENTLLSGGYCKLPMQLSKDITKDNIHSGIAFSIKWLKQQSNITGTSKLKLSFNAPLAKLADSITTTKPTWNGCNASTWKHLILKVNGHDERMQYGGQDREMGERLINSGVNSKQIRHRAILLHLDHARGYKTAETLKINKEIRDNTKSNKKIWTEFGIKKQDQPD